MGEPKLLETDYTQRVRLSKTDLYVPKFFTPYFKDKSHVLIWTDKPYIMLEPLDKAAPHALRMKRSVVTRVEGMQRLPHFRLCTTKLKGLFKEEMLPQSYKAKWLARKRWLLIILPASLWLDMREA